MATESGFDWYRKSKERDSYWVERAKNSFALTVERVMKQKEVKKKDLAERLGQSPANVSKVLRGDANLTIETMTKLALALDVEVSIQLMPRKVSSGSRLDSAASLHTALPDGKSMAPAHSKTKFTLQDEAQEQRLARQDLISACLNHRFSSSSRTKPKSRAMPHNPQRGKRKLGEAA